MKSLFVKKNSPLRTFFPLVRKTRQWSWKYFDRTAKRLLVCGGNVPFLDVVAAFPEDVGYTYSTSLFWNGPEAYEPDTSHLIALLLGKVRLFLDVGSNIGIYAVYAGLKHPDVFTCAFEPVPEIWEKNVAFHRANNLPVERVFSLAMSDNDQPKRIFIVHYDDGLPDEQTPTLRPDTWQADEKHARSVEIKCTSLDLFQSAHKLPDGPCLLKIDVENYEAAVLRGGRAFISQRRPWIVCEILSAQADPRAKAESSDNRETLQLVKELGYVPYALTPQGLFRMTPVDFERPRTFKDFLLFPAEKAPGDAAYLPLESLKEMSFS